MPELAEEDPGYEADVDNGKREIRTLIIGALDDNRHGGRGVRLSPPFSHGINIY